MATKAAPGLIVRSIPREETRAASKAASVPWYIWCSLGAVTSAVIGANWDISWHMSIGRDTFWTPAHMAIYLCGALAGLAFGYIILATTFVKDAPLAPASVHIWGFRAPLGAFIASWGGITMLVSAPFDNWWHSAYGLDVEIISPPHIVLFMGVYGVLLGTMVLIAGHMNRVSGRARELARHLFVYACGMLLIMVMTMVLEYMERSLLHTARPYIVMALLTPVVLTVAARAPGFRFGATYAAAIFTLFRMGLVWTLPLFPAEPKLGPVYQHVTHFIPEAFPVLLIVPALAMDLLRPKMAKWNAWRAAAASSGVFLSVLLAVEWPFASFLMSPAARNRFFGSMYFWYGELPTSLDVHYQFWPFETAAQLWTGLLIALAVGTLAFRFGISRGEWLRLIKR